MLGVRFRHRREHLNDPMRDDEWIIEEANRTIVVFCDAKRGAEDFNEAWTNRNRKVMESVLAFVGVIPDLERVAGELYETGRSEQPDTLITLLLIHHAPEQRVSMGLKSAKRIQIEHASRFIHRRFKEYGLVKTDHNQWGPSGHKLWDLYNSSRRSEDQFVRSIMREIGIPPTECADAQGGSDDRRG